MFEARNDEGGMEKTEMEEIAVWGTRRDSGDG